MIIDYDHNPSATTDEKLRALVESIQMALNEITSEIRTLERKIEELETE